MRWDTDHLLIEPSNNLIHCNLGRQIVQSFKDNGILNIQTLKSGEKEICLKDQLEPNMLFCENINKGKIPCCKLIPKFKYESHIDKIRNIDHLETRDFTCNKIKICTFTILFVTIEVYDQVIAKKVENLNSFFGHEVIDLLFNEVECYLKENTRCIVIWIGTRDCLSQESLLNTEINELPIQSKAVKNEFFKTKKFIDQSCLDKCIISLLIDNSVDSIEVKNDLEAIQYFLSIISSISEIQKRPISSKYKPRITSGSNGSQWTTQLMQIPGLSEDSARAIEKIYKAPRNLIAFIKDNIQKQKYEKNNKYTIFDYPSNTFKYEIQDSDWFNKLSNISFLCSKGLNSRKLGKALARKLVLLYSNFSMPADTFNEFT